VKEQQAASQAAEVTMAEAVQELKKQLRQAQQQLDASKAEVWAAVPHVCRCAQVLRCLTSHAVRVSH
jgi:hypothetical protein